MANLRRTLTLAGIGALSLGLVAMWQTPRPTALPPERAPTLQAFYAPPVEEVQTERLADGETLTGLLSRASITGADLADLLLSVREVRNPRNLRPGIEVTVRRWVASGLPRAVEIRLNPDTTVKLVRGDAGWNPQLVQTRTQLDTVFASGVIDEGRTLYESIVEDDRLGLPIGERLELVGQLASVFQYSLDFSREIQPGDSYRLAYERDARPDGTARSRRILAAEVKSQGKAYTAIFYQPRGASGGYYDAAGKPLKRGISLYPIDFVRITSRFTWSRYHPVLGIFRAHLGTDFGARTGTPAKATADGTVVSAGWAGGYGRMVVLRLWNGYTLRYGHLSRFASGIRPGKKVSQGQTIAYVGSSGLSTGPHLHYEIRDARGKPLDLKKANLPPSGALDRSALRAFRVLAAERMALLDQVQARQGPHLAQGALSAPSRPRAGEHGTATE
ncbi:MAG TPA: peptidoglycan DD-metalloendopeptidase family protein [Longimicrobiales bacterium]